MDQLEVGRGREQGILCDRASSGDDIRPEHVFCATGSLASSYHGLYPLSGERIKVIALLCPGRPVGCLEERERDGRGRIEFQGRAGLILVFVCRPWEARVVRDLSWGSDSFPTKRCGGRKIAKEVWGIHSKRGG